GGEGGGTQRQGLEVGTGVGSATGVEDSAGAGVCTGVEDSAGAGVCTGVGDAAGFEASASSGSSATVRWNSANAACAFCIASRLSFLPSAYAPSASKRSLVSPVPIW